MANLHEIKLRIKSITETRQITRAMKLISAAKLRKARQQLDQTLPYFGRVKLTMADILLHSGNIDNIYFDLRHEKERKKKGYVIITGDKGLAGSYNHNIIKLVEERLAENPKSVLFIAGHVGKNYFIRKGCRVDPDFDYPVQGPTVYRAREIAEIILESFKKGNVDEVYMIYTLMETALKLVPIVSKLLPLDPDALKEELKIIGKVEDKYAERLIYEPSPEKVFEVLVPKYVKGIVYGALVEAFTSEQTARMSAMDNATKNADEMLQKLGLFYNRTRQCAITREISEVTGGAAVLGSV